MTKQRNPVEAWAAVETWRVADALAFSMWLNGGRLGEFVAKRFLAAHARYLKAKKKGRSDGR